MKNSFRLLFTERVFPFLRRKAVFISFLFYFSGFAFGVFGTLFWGAARSLRFPEVFLRSDYGYFGFLFSQLISLSFFLVPVFFSGLSFFGILIPFAMLLLKGSCCGAFLVSILADQAGRGILYALCVFLPTDTLRTVLCLLAAERSVRFSSRLLFSGESGPYRELFQRYLSEYRAVFLCSFFVSAFCALFPLIFDHLCTS